MYSEQEDFSVDDKFGDLISNYTLNINSCYRSRGCYYVDTPAGLLQLRNYTGCESRQYFEASLKSHICSLGFCLLDFNVKNDEGNYITLNQYGEKFVLRHWYPGEECSLQDAAHIALVSRGLARLHLCMRGFVYDSPVPDSYRQSPVSNVFAKRNRELKKVKSYMRLKKQRNSFENNFLAICDSFCSEAENAENALAEIDLNSIYSQAEADGTLCHGNFTHHNIIMLPDDIAVTGFDKAAFGLQLTDFYLLFRKVMEKNLWDPELGNLMLNEYEAVKPFSATEKRLLYILLLYPEKFWKISNSYFNTKKSWVPRKNIQKLDDICALTAYKNAYLKDSGLLS